ncbi:1-phosphofructokinase family hexose kinase [Mesobacterium sp. TK19101]|uniref:Phosphofructokinase n=1 Tax=Mesobacterium hydrothermale TaxID=3111907 RepID=A0ABU6HHL6_9RHOB|nr:1-phosphofructokinase family hexose kinase [Mesobacterium sp. TK19101]MEC3861944.1 1-phosphofructokinase family hexose kinase [Mesobacterium sp. TK19101]
MPRILTVTLNPAIDISTSAETVRPEDKLRCAPPVLDAGGGGTNVARAIAHLGGQAQAFVAVAGFHGAQFVELLRNDGVDPVIFETHGETRQSLAVIDRATGQQYRFVMPGPDWTQDTADAALDAIDAATPHGGVVVLSGSQPPGVPEDFPPRLAGRVEARNATLVLDTSGPAMQALMQSGALTRHVLRLDQAESEELAGKPLRTMDELASFARHLVTRNVAGTVILALGAEGSVLANSAGCWHAVTPPVPVRSKVGAGDSFVGAFTLALSQGLPPEQALRHGVAAASAAVMSDATDLCVKADVDRLLDSCALQHLPC